MVCRHPFLKASSLQDCTLSCVYFSLVLTDPPEPPSNPPEVLDVTKSSVSLSWSRPKDDGGSRVTGYYIERKETSTDKWVRHNKTQITTTMYTVTGLVPDAEYQFRIIAQNDVGLSETSPASEPVVCKDPFGEQSVSKGEGKPKKQVSFCPCFFFLLPVNLILFSIIFFRQAEPTRRT